MNTHESLSPYSDRPLLSGADALGGEIIYNMPTLTRHAERAGVRMTTYRGEQVSTWADGFGRWHARVDFPASGYGNAGALNIDRHWDSIRAAARRAIRSELLARGVAGSQFVVRLEVEKVVQQPSSMVFTSATFMERIEK